MTMQSGCLTTCLLGMLVQACVIPFSDYPKMIPFSDYPKMIPFSDYPKMIPFSDYPIMIPFSDYPIKMGTSFWIHKSFCKFIFDFYGPLRLIFVWNKIKQFCLSKKIIISYCNWPHLKFWLLIWKQIIIVFRPYNFNVRRMHPPEPEYSSFYWVLILM